MTKAEQMAAFLKTIEADRYDGATRKVFADWLEENGYDDEALVQRSWTREKQESIDWLTDFASELSDEYETFMDDLEIEGSYTMTYEDLIAAANAYLEKGEAFCLPFDTPDRVYDEIEVFWRHFEVATGRKVDEERKEGTFFVCAC